MPDRHLAVLDGALLGLFMVSACCSTVFIEHPESGLRAVLPDELTRRALAGLTMGLTAVALVYSRWGRRSGALMNPALTFCFVRLGKLELGRAARYAVAQFAGAALGVAVARLLLGERLAAPSVNYCVTAPGAGGPIWAWAGEFAIAFTLVSVVTAVNRRSRLAPYGGVFAAVLVALFITFESPLSGMSLNPARSFGSAAVSGSWSALWIYLTAPPAGMFASVELQRWLGRGAWSLCGKLSHGARDFVRCDCLASGVEARPIAGSALSSSRSEVT